MNSLKKDDGSTIKNQSEILNETMNFYKCLYSQRHVTDINLYELLRNKNVPKLNDGERLKLEGEIKYDELLYCLKKTSNNTSPGLDGFTYEFYKNFSGKI